MEMKLERQMMRELAAKIAAWLKNTMGNTVDVEALVGMGSTAFASDLPAELQRPENYMRFVLYLTNAYVALVGGITDKEA